MSTGDRSEDELESRGAFGLHPALPAVVAILALVVGGVFVGSQLFGSDGDGSETVTDAANTTTSTSATADDASGDDAVANDAQGGDENADALATSDGDDGDDADGDGADEGDSNDSSDGDADDGNDTNSDDAAAPGADDQGDANSPSVPTTAGDNSTDETVEEDQGATPDSDGPADDPTELETTTTTALSADGSRCRITPSDVNGQSGVTKPSEDGICAGIEVTLRSVVETTNVGSIDWANDLKLCEKHPSATQIGFAVSSASGSTEVTDTFFRGDVADGQDLVDALNISFSGGYTPTAGVQPIAVCRSTDAEMVIVHRGNS